jgi:hypothetical protein
MKAPIYSGWISGALFLLAFLLVSCAHLQHSQWPLIKEVSIRHHFAADKEYEQSKAVIYGQDGKPLYCLDARFGWRDYETKDYDFSGVLDCRLYDCRLYPLNGSLIEEGEQGIQYYPTLLFNTTNATADWQTYGRFTDEDLAGLIGADASRSIVQRCWVRGMAIKIEVFNVKEQKGSKTIKSLDLIFTAKNNPAATAAIAAESRINTLTGEP